MTTNAPFQLMLWGPARLEHQGREIKLQRKGLAILLGLTQLPSSSLLGYPFLQNI